MENGLHGMCRAIIPAMGRTRKDEWIDLGTQSGRLRALMLMGNYTNKTRFADELGWPPSRLSNYLKDRPLTKRAFLDLRRVFQGITWEWVMEGKADQLSVGFERRIREVVAPFEKETASTLRG